MPAKRPLTASLTRDRPTDSRAGPGACPLMRRWVLAAIVILAGDACSYRSGTTGPPPSEVASVVVTAPAMNPTVGVGQTMQFTATPRDANGSAITGLAVVWNSSDQTIATVDANGLVRGIKAGGPSRISAVIGGATGSLDVSVTP